MTTTSLGIVIPSTNPTFLALVGVHIVLSLVCVVSGLIAMLSRKERGRHSTFGTLYFWSFSGVFLTAAILSVLRWEEDRILLLLAVLGFGCAALGRHAMRQRWPLRVHAIAMATSYIVLLTAFYVDNGKNLPIWKDLPSLAYWLVPSAVGLPLLLRTLLRHPLLRRTSQAARP